MKPGKRLTKRYIKYIFAIFFITYVFITNIYARPKTYDAKATFLPNEDILAYMIKDVVDAKDSIFIAIYMFKTTDDIYQKSGLLEDALIKALKKGVKVFIVMDIGKDGDITTEINKETADELLKAGAKVVFDSKDVRTHAKLMVIDEEIVYVGSHNYTHSAFKYNNEASVRIVSKGLAQDAVKYIKGLVR